MAFFCYQMERKLNLMTQNLMLSLLGGDQLTVVRIRSTQALRDTLDSATERYEGLIPVIEDWHAKVILLQVCSQRYRHNMSITM